MNRKPLIYIEEITSFVVTCKLGVRKNTTSFANK